MFTRAGITAIGLIAPLLVVSVLALSGEAQADESDGTVDVTIDVAIDVDTTGNGDNVLGPTESCNETPLEVGDTIDVDVVVRGIPDYAGAGYDGRIVGTDLTLLFDPSVVHVVGSPMFEGPTILKAAGPPQPFVWYDFNYHFGDSQEEPPGTIGATEVSLIDLSVYQESGDGVLMRFTLQAVGIGTTALDVADNIAGRVSPGIYYNTAAEVEAYAINESDATIAVGEEGCSAPMPTTFVIDTPISVPSPSPSPTDTRPSGVPSATPRSTGKPIGGDSAGGGYSSSTVTPAALPRAGAGQSSDASSWPIVVAAGLLISAGIAAGFAYARRRL